MVGNKTDKEINKKKSLPSMNKVYKSVHKEGIRLGDLYSINDGRNTARVIYIALTDIEHSIMIIYVSDKHPFNMILCTLQKFVSGIKNQEDLETICPFNPFDISYRNSAIRGIYRNNLTNEICWLSNICISDRSRITYVIYESIDKGIIWVKPILLFFGSIYKENEQIKCHSSTREEKIIKSRIPLKEIESSD